MKQKVLDQDAIELMLERLNCCHAVLLAVAENASINKISAQTIYGCCDLLESIYRNFEVNIAGAEDFIPAPEVAV